MSRYTVIVAHDGSEWANACDLCRNTRRVGEGILSPSEQECPWCRAVRLKYGSYWYPVDRTCRHLFVGSTRIPAPGYFSVKLPNPKETL